MSDADQARWDERFRTTEPNWTPSPLVSQYALPATPGAMALDIACGAGRDSLYLAGLGYQVTAVDVSPVALDLLRAEAQRRGLVDRIHPIHADLDVWRPPPTSYDLVVQNRFFDRALLPHVVAAVKPQGRLMMDVFNVRRLETHPPFNPAYAAQMGELAAACQGWSILHHDESAGDEGDQTRLVAEKR